MDYEDVLLNLYYLAAIPQSPMAGYFSSKTVSAIFKWLARTSALPVPLSRPYPAPAFEVRRISGYLDKLFRMGLLKRRRVKRGFRTKAGKLFGRGYIYEYKLSPQGLRYAEYLEGNIGVPREERKKKRYKGYWMEDEATLKALARSDAPFPAVAVIAEDRKRQISAEGIYRRFPISFDEGLYASYLAARMGEKKTGIKLEKSMRETDNAKFEAEVYRERRKIEEKQTPLRLLMRAKDKIEKGTTIL